MEPLQWNTLDEAAQWLTEKTGEKWSAKHVLSAALNYPKGNKLSIAYLKAAMPRDTKFALYVWDADKGTPENPFVRKFSSPWDQVRLCLVHVRDLLVHGETAVSIVRSPDDDFGIENEYVFIEPLDQEHVVTVDMIGVTAGDLVALLERLPKETAPTQQQNSDGNRRVKHTTKELELLYKAVVEFWENHDPETPPKKDTVVEWFVKRGVSKGVAESLDTVMRTDKARKGGNKKING